MINFTSPIKENSDCPVAGKCQSLIISNFDAAGLLPSFKISWPTYSTLDFMNSHLSSLNDTLYFKKTLYAHSKYRISSDLASHHNKTSSIVTLLSCINVYRPS